MSVERWYRVRIDSSGRAVTCEETDRAPGGDGGGVYYVRASSVVGAQAAAYELYKNNQKALMQERRDRYRREGKCPKCGGKPEAGKRHCAKCLRRQSVDSKRKRARLRGEDVMTPPKHLAFAAARAARERELTLRILQEARAAFQLGGFLAWVDGRIAEVVGAEKDEEPVRYDHAS